MVSHSSVSISSLLIKAFVAFALFISLQTSAATTLTASVDRNPVMERESFVLKIEVNDSVNTNDLDLSQLQKTGFIVGRTATGSQTQIINGTIQKSTTWSVVLVAKSAGNYTIPSFSVQGASSQPINVKVVKTSTANNTRNESIFIQNNIETNELYVQQSIKLTTKLFISPQVDLQSGSLSEPKLDGAFIQQQGKDKDTSEIVNGIRYRVIERIYTITPQSSGKFSLESPTFNGDVITNTRRRSSFSSFSQSKPVTAFGEDFSIDVKPIPTNYTGVWLPSSIVQLNEEWSPNKETFEVGEPITRTITLTALNVNEEQLPEIKGNYPSNVKVYPDQSSTYSAVRQNALVSQRTNTEAIVANAPGTYTFPEIRISWFNTKTKRQDVAVLPAKTVKVTGNASVPAPLDTGASNTSANDYDNMASECNCDQAAPLLKEKSNELSYWLILLSGWLAFVISIIISIYTRRKYAKSPIIENYNAMTSPVSNFDLKVFKRACLSHQKEVVSNLLKQWIPIQFSGCKSYDDAKPFMSKELIVAINELNEARFSNTQKDWKGEALWQAVKSAGASTEKPETNSTLPPLN